MMLREKLKHTSEIGKLSKESGVKFGLVIILLVTFQSVGFTLFQGADAQLDLPTLDEIERSADAELDLPSLDEIMNSPPVGTTGGWEGIIEQGPSESTGGWEGIIEQGPSESTGGWEGIIEQGPPSGDFTDQLIEAMEKGQIDPGTALELGTINTCLTNNAISGIQGPVVEGGFEITHTDPSCPGMTFNGP